MTLKQASKIYFRSAVVVLPIWILGLYAIEVILERAMGFPDNARGWGYHSAYHYDPLAFETVSLMVVAMLLLLRREISKNQDRAYFMEIPLVVFAYLYLANINGVAHLFQNINPPVLYYGVLLLFIPILFLIGIMVALFSYWRYKFHERSVKVNSSEGFFAKAWQWSFVKLYFCTVVCLLLLYYSVDKLAIVLSPVFPSLKFFFISRNFATFFLSGVVAPILRWMHLDSYVMVLIIMSSGPLMVISMVVFFLLRRISSSEPRRVYRVEVPIITLISWLFGAAIALLACSSAQIPRLAATVMELFPPLITWLWVSATAYALIRVKNRLQL